MTCVIGASGSAYPAATLVRIDEPHAQFEAVNHNGDDPCSTSSTATAAFITEPYFVLLYALLLASITPSFQPSHYHFRVGSKVVSKSTATGIKEVKHRHIPFEPPVSLLGSHTR